MNKSGKTLEGLGDWKEVVRRGPKSANPSIPRGCPTQYESAATSPEIATAGAAVSTGAVEI